MFEVYIDLSTSKEKYVNNHSKEGGCVWSLQGVE